MAHRRIDVWADVCCPFTHVGLVRLLAARQERGADTVLAVHAWPLELVNGLPLDAEHVAHEVDALRRSVAPDLFDGFDPARFPSSSLPAFAVAAAASSIDDRLGEEMSMALRRALFEDGEDVADPDVLAAICAAVGIDGVVEDLVPAHEAAVLDDYRLGRSRGVVGSPHFFVDERDYFCPTLEISQTDGVFSVTSSPDAVEDFVESCFG